MRAAAMVLALMLGGILVQACRGAPPPPTTGTPQPGATAVSAKAATPTRAANAPVPANTVAVTHWVGGHLMPEGRLLPAFARQFNESERKTESGKRIEVRLVQLDSYQQVDALVSSVERGVITEPNWGEPTIVTPVADYWLAEANDRLRRTVVDLTTTEELAISYAGLATYREMAECIGWPKREIGYRDVVALRNDPRGWAACPTAKVQWGPRPLMSFSDPNSSTTGRSVLFALYAVAANKSPDQLTVADVTDPKVVQAVKEFQTGVDHYVPNTLILQTKMTFGYSHFYWIAENVLVQLYQGKANVVTPGGTQVQPLNRRMEFIYPKEGSVAHNNPAGIVQAKWVSQEQVEAAKQWIAFLREDDQQNALMDEGFRPATRLPLRCPICPQFGLDPSQPSVTLTPIRPAPARAIIENWGIVKKPGIVTFVVDTSGSMSGPRLQQAKDGMKDALDGLAQNTSVGFLEFAESIKSRTPIAPVGTNKFTISSQVDAMQASGNTHLYDALREAIQMTDSAPGPPETIRGVVVITDGADNGRLPLSDLVTMMSRIDEAQISEFGGHPGVDVGTDIRQARVNKRDILGVGLRSQTRQPIHIFYVGVQGADLEIGRILAEATNAAFQPATDRSLAAVLATFGKYF